MQTGIPGITIQPGIMPSATVSPSDNTQLQAKKKMMLYDLSFTTFNAIP